MVATRNDRTRPTSTAEARVAEIARREADRQARRIRWSRLLEARRCCIEWHAFSLWVRVITEAEGQLPAWLVPILERRCPGLLGSLAGNDNPERPRAPLLTQQISEWSEGNVLGEAEQGGWLRAVTYYAVRDPDFARDCAYAEHCAKQWRRRRPSAYPSFEDWKRASEECSDEILDRFEMNRETRRVLRMFRLIGAQRLAEAVESYMEWEAFTYWLRSILEADIVIPETAKHELQSRCPGFLDRDRELRTTLSPHDYTRRWKALLEWGEGRFFLEAAKGGWLDALALSARAHPRSARTVDYWVFYWDEHWSDQPLAAYPSFPEWRRAADEFTMQSGSG